MKVRKLKANKDLRVMLSLLWADLPRQHGENHVVQFPPLSGTYGDFLISRFYYRAKDRKQYLRKHDMESVIYSRARKIFLRRFRKANGGKLFCEYCGRGPLKEDFNNLFNPLPLATIDHKKPLSKGGARFDFDNMACSCENCNRKKGNKYE